MRNKSIFLSIIVLIGISVIGINQSFAQTDVEIPPWVKGVASFWVEDKIDDGEFAEALEFLIDSDIIELDSNIIQSDSIVIVPEQENDWEEKYNKVLTLSKKLDADKTAQIQKISQEKEDIIKKTNKDYDARINNIIKEHETEQQEQIEYHRISEEEKTKLQEEIRDLKKQIFDLETKLSK